CARTHGGRAHPGSTSHTRAYPLPRVRRSDAVHPRRARAGDTTAGGGAARGALRAGGHGLRRRPRLRPRRGLARLREPRPAGGRRHADPADWSPPLVAVFARAAERPTGIKLGPALDHALLPDGVEAQWVSVDREVVELVVWTGALAREGVGRAALLLTGSGA